MMCEDAKATAESKGAAERRAGPQVTVPHPGAGLPAAGDTGEATVNSAVLGTTTSPSGPSGASSGGELPTNGREPLERMKDRFLIAQSAATVLALIAGAGWFIWQGQSRARFRVTQEIRHLRVAPDENRLIVDVRISNVGTVAAKIPCVRVWVEQVIPQLDIAHPYLSHPGDSCANEDPFTLEPGEENQVLAEPTILGSVQTIRVNSFAYLDDEKRKLGWGRTTVYDLSDPGPVNFGAPPQIGGTGVHSQKASASNK